MLQANHHNTKHPCHKTSYHKASRPQNIQTIKHQDHKTSRPQNIQTTKHPDHKTSMSKNIFSQNKHVTRHCLKKRPWQKPSSQKSKHPSHRTISYKTSMSQKTLMLQNNNVTKHISCTLYICYKTSFSMLLFFRSRQKSSALQMQMHMHMGFLYCCWKD